MRRGSVALLSLALLVASVLLVPAVSVAQPGPATGRITYQAVAPTDAETALRNDVIDVYQFGIPRTDAQSIGENDPEIRLWKGFSGLNDILLNPAPDPSGLNPFSLIDVRYALNFVTNWKHHAEVTLGDLAVPMDTYASALFPEYPVFSDVIQKHNFRFDPELADKLVTAAMEDAGAVKVSGLWEFGGNPVTVIGIVRIEDERLEIGNAFTAELQALGFTVDLQLHTFSSAIPLVYQTDPQAFQWHFYTEGWGLASPPRYVSDEAGFFGAPAFDNMPGWGNPTFFQYQNALIDQLSQVLDSQFTSAAQREDALRQVTDLIMQESVRLFGLTIQRVDATRTPVQGVTEDVGRGLVHPYLAREVFIQGEMTVDVGLPFITGDDWNPYGGFRTIGSVFPRFATLDPEVDRHPFTGDVIPLRVGYSVSTAGPTGTLSVPPNAVLWDPVGNSWSPVGAGMTAVSQVDFDYSLYTVSKWHHGIDINMADILYGVATAFELAFDPFRSGIEPGLAARLAASLGNLKALEVLGANTIRAYVDIWHFDDNELAALATRAVPVFHMPWELLAAQEDVVFVQLARGFSPQNTLLAPVLDLVDPVDAGLVAGTLAAFLAGGFFPANFFTVAGVPYDMAPNAASRYLAGIGWFGVRNILYISDGPFFLNAFDASTPSLELLAFNDPTYPFQPGDFLFGVPNPGLILRVQGTSLGDSIQILGPAGLVKVNGQTVLTFDPAVRNLFDIDTGGGDDSVLLIDPPGPNRYDISTGDGDDILMVFDGGGKDEYIFQTEAGDDVVKYKGGAHRDGVRIYAGAGDDQVAIKGGPEDDAYVVMGGDGSDDLVMSDGAGGDRYGVNAGPGDDVVDVKDTKSTDGYNLCGSADTDSLTFDDAPQADQDTLAFEAFEVTVLT